jgi:predicted transglutaminase-like cysteine proteinase
VRLQEFIRRARYLMHLLLVCLVGVIAGSSLALNDNPLHELMHKRYGDDGVAMLKAWLTLIESNTGLPEVEQVKQVNDFFNQHIRFREDIDQWQQQDYWATPLETLGTRAADCEDYTIAKYVTLLKLGVPVERLRLIYVKAQIGGSYSKVFQAHMVLGYYPTSDAMPWVLDNLISSVEPAGQRPDLRPVFSFNSDGLWVGNAVQSQADPTVRLSRWRNLLDRMQQEGSY